MEGYAVGGKEEQSGRLHNLSQIFRFNKCTKRFRPNARARGGSTPAFSEVTKGGGRKGKEKAITFVYCAKKA